ncbi:MAG: hypothetical protein ACLFMX_02720 [Halobacteriales archaeon]
MQTVSLTIRGDGADSAPRAIADIESDGRYDHQGDGFAVVALERFYYRILASVQTTVVFELVDDDVLEITVVAGGGATKLAKADHGAEGDHARRIVEAIEQYCRRRDLEVER